MSEVYSGLRRRRKRTHPSKCPCCITDQEVEPENEASAGSENVNEVNKEIRQSKRKRSIKERHDGVKSDSESEQIHNEPSKKRKLRNSCEETLHRTQTSKKAAKTSAKPNNKNKTSNEKYKVNTKTKTNQDSSNAKNITNKLSKSNNRNIKTSKPHSDEELESEDEREDLVKLKTNTSKLSSEHSKAKQGNNGGKGKRSNKSKQSRKEGKKSQPKSDEEDIEENGDHTLSKSDITKKSLSKTSLKGKIQRKVQKPSIVSNKQLSDSKDLLLSEDMQLKVKVFDNLSNKIKLINRDMSFEEVAETLMEISSESLQMVIKSSQNLVKSGKIPTTSSRQEKKRISDTEEIVSQAAEALVSFRTKSPISREDNCKGEKITITQVTPVNTTAPLNLQSYEKTMSTAASSAASAIQALMQIQSTSSVLSSAFPATPASVPSNILHSMLPTVSISQSFSHLLPTNLTTSFTNLMPMMSSHGALPSFNQIAAQLRPQSISGINTTVPRNQAIPGNMPSPLIRPNLSNPTLPSPSLMLPNQPLVQPQLQQPLSMTTPSTTPVTQQPSSLTSPLMSSKPALTSLTTVKNTVPNVEPTLKKTNTPKQAPLQQPLKGMEEVVGNVGTHVPQQILWNLKSPVVFLGSPQNLGAVPRNLVASPNTTQSSTSLDQAGYRPVAPKPVSKSDNCQTTSSVSSVPNMLTLGGRPILPRTLPQGGDDGKKLQSPHTGMPLVPQLPTLNTSNPYSAAASTLQALTQVTPASPKSAGLMSVSFPGKSSVYIQDNTESSSPTVSAKQAVKKLVHERTKSAELKKEASGNANLHLTTKLQTILPLPPRDPTTSAGTSAESTSKNNEFNLEQAATALLSIGVPDGIETIGLKQSSSDPSKDDHEEDVVFTSKGTFRVGDVDVDPRYNRIGREGYTCGKCNKIFTSLSYLARHIKRVCPDMSCRKWKCTLCDKAFRHPFGLQQHVYTHTGERPHKCPLCPKAFYSSNDLRRHSRIHSGERPYRCKHCDKSFATTISLKTHTYIHTGEKPHKCPQCPKTFATSSKLGRHIVTHSEQRPYSCDQCPKSFNRSGDLRRHNLAVHDGKEKSFVCDVCSATFSKSADLRRHNTTVHQKTVKTLECEDCGTQFATLLCLKMHRETYHKKPSTSESDKINTCNVCGKTYSTPALLTKHMIASHETPSTATYNLSQFKHIAPKPAEQVTDEGGNG